MNYTTYIWKTSDPAGHRQEYSAHSLKLDDCQTCYYAGMTSQHLEARLLSPYPATTGFWDRKHGNRDSVEVLWSKEYDNRQDASTVENTLINWMLEFKDNKKYARVLNINNNRDGLDLYDPNVPKALVKDVREAVKTVKQSYTKTTKLIPLKHKERLQKAIEENAERIAKANEEIQNMLAEYVKEHQPPKAKQARTKTQWDIVTMRKTLASLQKTLVNYKTNKATA